MAELTWYRGSLHNHTNRSDGDSDPEEVADWYCRNGYDFIVFTDEKSEDGTESNKYVCAGFFDQYWRLSEQSTCYSETPR